MSERSKRILIVCGAGVATSTVVAQKVREYMEDQGISIKTEQTTITQLGGADDYDLIVSTTELPSDLNTPSVSGRPFLTGVGQEQALEEIREKLQA